MTPETALADPLAKRLLGSALDRLDRSRPEDRTNAVRIPIDLNTAPEIFKAETIADREVAWHVLDVLADAGIGILAYRRAARHGSREDRQPVFEVSTARGNEDRLRTFYGRPRPGLKYSEEWRALVRSSDLDEDIKGAIVDLPVSIPGRSAADVFHRLISIRALYNERVTLHLREVSGRTFWGLSKVLDNRSDLIAALLGLAECPYPAQPIHLNIYFAGAFSWILFVENKTSFERAIRDAGEALLHERFAPFAGAALNYSSGFMGTAGRIRRSTGSTTFYCLDAISDSDQVKAFDACFYSNVDVDAAFWVTSTMQAWPSLQACEPPSPLRGRGSQVTRLCWFASMPAKATLPRRPGKLARNRSYRQAAAMPTMS